jgi:hypothetical protein
MSDDITDHPEPDHRQPGADGEHQLTPVALTPRRPALIGLAEAAGFAFGEPTDEDIIADHARRWTSRAILVATLLLAVLNSPSIQTWATTLPPTWGSQTVDDLAEVWTRRLEQLGLDQPRSVVHDHYQAFQQMSWRDVARSLRVHRPPAGNPKPHG